MLFETSRQAPLFLLFFCCGAVQGAVYALLYLVRRKHKWFLTVPADILFALFFFFSAAWTLLKSDGGAFRPYQAAAMLLGAVISDATFGYFLKKVIDFWAQVLYNVYKRLAKNETKGRVDDGAETN